MADESCGMTVHKALRVDERDSEGSGGTLNVRSDEQECRRGIDGRSFSENFDTKRRDLDDERKSDDTGGEEGKGAVDSALLFTCLDI